MNQRLLNQHAIMSCIDHEPQYQEAPIQWVVMNSHLPPDTGTIQVNDDPEVGILNMRPKAIYVTLQNEHLWNIAIQWPLMHVSHHQYNVNQHRLYNWLPALHPSLLRLYYAGFPETLNEWSRFDPSGLEESTGHVRETDCQHEEQKPQDENGKTHQARVVSLVGLHKHHDD